MAGDGPLDPELLAGLVGPVAPLCTISAGFGVVVTTEGKGALTGRCGCGHPLAGASLEGVRDGFLVHLQYRQNQ